MIVKFLDSQYKIIYILDNFNSLIWTDRFNSFGDFDIVTAPKEVLIALLPDIKYASISESDHTMFFETFSIDSTIEAGVDLILKGRSLESILDRRVITNPTVISGSLQDGIEDLLIEHIISPSDTDRRINNFNFIASSDPLITDLVVDVQFVGSLYQIISDICLSSEIGFKITLNSSNEFEFRLYPGIDRSYNQLTIPFVIFSPTFDNLLKGNYIESSVLLKSHAYVAGEQGIGNFRTIEEVVSPIGDEPTGIERRELYLEASITKNVEGGELTDEEYLEQLRGYGLEELAKNIRIKTFDGSIDTSMYAFGEAYSMGDIIQIMDGYGHSTHARVIEMIYSQDIQGIKMYPSFLNIGT